jgi:hypothetical protein
VSSASPLASEARTRSSPPVVERVRATRDPPLAVLLIRRHPHGHRPRPHHHRHRRRHRPNADGRRADEQGQEQQPQERPRVGTPGPARSPHQPAGTEPTNATPRRKNGGRKLAAACAATATSCCL